MLRESGPSGSNGSDTNFGPIAIKGSGHETATMVNGETVHQAGAPELFTSTSFSPGWCHQLLSATASQPTITVSFPPAANFAFSNKNFAFSAAKKVCSLQLPMQLSEDWQQNNLGLGNNSINRI